jgi:hypothetical protein
VRAARGQALVLLGLTLLLLALAAFFTIGLGVRIKERLELQTLADTAAYDNAVATARTFNSIAVVNRTEWSLLVAQSAAQSYLSWSTAYLAALDGVGDAMSGNAGCGGVRALVASERERVEQVFLAQEPRAFAELLRLADAQEKLLRDDARLDYRHLEELVGKEKVAEAVIDAAAGASPWRVKPERARRRFNTGQLDPDCMHGVACDIAAQDFEQYRRNWTIMRHQHELFMGTRGDPFTVGRRGGDVLAALSWQQDMGSSYRSSVLFIHSADFALGPGNAVYPRMMPDSAMSDDHGRLVVDAPLCFAAGPREIRIGVELKNGAVAGENVHTWTAGGVTRHCPLEHDRSHTLPDLGQQKAWPLIIDLNDHHGDAEGLIDEQPTNRVELSRDYAEGPADPWDLRFGWGGRRYDSTAKGTAQRAVARGLAYYHRGGDWEETANLVNPFWQATLISNRWEEVP